MVLAVAPGLALEKLANVSWRPHSCAMRHTFVGRTPASAAGPLAGRWDFVETSTSRARAPGAGCAQHGQNLVG